MKKIENYDYVLKTEPILNEPTEEKNNIEDKYKMSWYYFLCELAMPIGIVLTIVYLIGNIGGMQLNQENVNIYVVIFEIIIAILWCIYLYYVSKLMCEKKKNGYIHTIILSFLQSCNLFIQASFNYNNR